MGWNSQIIGPVHHYRAFLLIRERLESSEVIKAGEFKHRKPEFQERISAHGDKTGYKEE